ncbi:autotransporter assembly complex protein TamA [Notoacmeibacter ruber]|uniref:Outer membrane protein assembly factor n=1 Tax=Notoacmeibacter ruber TaxID=2670375 RepID=A0A3L7JD80_9HYPH|nr:autotransporter assembly complex family protein [Notoacmeibacter ruber]RLQ88430.1 outer membrane protein assembly factor [Notoacmeibacter ruber]
MTRNSRIVLLAVVAMIAATQSVIPAHAFTLFGKTFFEKEQPEIIGEPQPYEVTFDYSGDPDLEDTAKNVSSLWGGRDEPANGSSGLIVTARGDYKSILGAFYNRGYYGPVIRITIDGREVSDMPPDVDLGDPAQVVVHVESGPAFTFSSAEIVDQAPPAESRRDEVEDPVDEGFAEGEIARAGVIKQAGGLAVEAWRQQGYAKAEVGDRLLTADHATETFEAVIDIDPGRFAVYGDTMVEGTEAIDPEWLAFMVGLPRGQEFDPDDIDRATERLGRLDVFKAYSIREGEAIDAGGYLPVTAIVQEKPKRRIGFGATYSTTDGFGASSYWVHRNLWGRAERLRLDASVSGIDGTDYEDFNYLLGAEFTKPGIWTPDTDFNASLKAQRQVNDSYSINDVTGTAGISQIVTEDLKIAFGLTASLSQTEDDVFGQREFATIGTYLNAVFDNRDDPADATEGFYVDARIAPYQEFLYGNTFVRGLLDARSYFGLVDDRLVLAGRVKMGTILDPPIEETSPDLLFFAGGGGSVRGYDYQSIGVETGSGTIGGRSLAEASAEARVRVTDAIGVVGFVDIASVTEEPYPKFQDYQMGAGVGLRYRTPIGPIRLDAAVPINPRDGDPNFAIYAGIGQAF